VKRLLGLMGGKPNPTLFLAPLNGSLSFQDRAGGGTLTGGGAVRYAPASGARTNLIRNPSAAVSAGNTWIGTTGGSASRTTDTVLGPTAHRIAATSSANSGTIFWGSASVPGVAKIRNKAAHTFAADVALVSGTANWQLMFYELDAAGTVLGAALGGVSITPTAGGIRVLATYTPTANGVHSVCPGFRHLDASTSELDVRAATLVEGTYTELSHFDGSTGGVWLDPITGILGTANASPSVSQAVAWGEEGTTNTIPDPSFEAASISSNWVAAGSATISKVTTHACLGSAAGKVSCTASTSDGINSLNGSAAASGQTWTVQARVRAFASGDVGKTIQIGISERTSANALVIEGFGSAITLTDNWQYVEHTRTLSGGGTVAKATAKIKAAAAVAVDFVIDCAQLEQKGYASSYCDGSIGTGYSWSGTAHASSSTRTAAYLQVDEVGHINSVRGTLAARLLRTIDNGANDYIMWAGVDGTNDFIGPRIDSSDRASLICKVGSGSYSTIQRTGAITVDTWLSLFASWNGTETALSINDETQTTGTRDAPGGSVSSGSDLRFAANSSGTAQLNGYIGPILIADRPLTANERANLDARTSWAWGRL